MIPLKLCPQIRPRQLIIYGKCNENARPVPKPVAAEYYIYFTACKLAYSNILTLIFVKFVRFKVIKSCKNPNVFKK